MVVGNERAPGEEEATHHLEVIDSALRAETAADRRRVLADGLVRFGAALLVSMGELVRMHPDWASTADLLHEANVLFDAWLGGEVLTGGPEEPERRVAAARDMLMLFDFEPELHLRFAEAILALPAAHPDRDVGVAAAALRVFLGYAREQGDRRGVAAAVTTLLKIDAIGDDQLDLLIEEGRAANAASGGHSDILPAAIGNFTLRAIGCRDASDRAGWTQWRARTDRLVDELLTDTDAAPATLALAALAADVGGTSGRAIELFVAARSHPETTEHQRTVIGLQEMRRRLDADAGDLAEAEIVADFLLDVLPGLREEYVAALGVDATAEVGRAYANAGRYAVEALVRLDRWPAALAVLDSLKSSRFRHRVAMRASSEGRAVLERERALHALALGLGADVAPIDGAADRLGPEVRPVSALLEAYRRARPVVPEAHVASPPMADVAASLDEGEAVVVLGLTDHGTCAAVIDRAAVDRPVSAVHLPDWPLRRWLDAVGGDQATGWLYALGVPHEERDRPAALDGALAVAEEALGPVLRQWRDRFRWHRLTVVPHGVLHLLPFHALPVLADLDITAAPSLAQFVRSRARPPRPLAGSALVVANPAGDLLLSAIEADIVATRLGPRGVAVKRLDGPAATVRAVTRSMRDAGLLHLSSHGRSDMTDPERSFLLLAPVDARLADGFVRWAVDVAKWSSGDAEGNRRGTVPNFGTVQERAASGGAVLERWVDLDLTTTLWQYVRDGAVRLTGQTWSAADLLLDDGLPRCALAVLSACESADVGLAVDVDEHSGLAAAFELADVGTVVATLWPVSEGYAALFVDLLYAELAACPAAADVVAIVGAVSRRLRSVSGAEAAALVADLRAHSTDPRVRIRLEAFARRVAVQERPFARPWWWAAFAVRGHGTVMMGAG